MKVFLICLGIIFFQSSSIACDDTKLQKLVRAKNINGVKNLIGRIGVNGQNECGETALMTSVALGQNEIVEVLLGHGAKLEIRNNDGYTALLFVTSPLATSQTVNLLLSAGANINAQDNRGKSVIMLFDGREPWDPKYQNHYDKLYLLLEKGINVNLRDDYGYTAIMLDSSNLEVFIRFGAEVNLVNVYRSPLMIHAGYDNVYVVKALVEAGADINFQAPVLGASHDMSTPLIESAKSDNGFYVISYLIDQGAKLELQDISGKTALLHAAVSFRNNAIAPLIKAGANINHQDKDGNTALILTSCDSENHINERNLKYLIEHGANINLRNNNGMTALANLKRCMRLYYPSYGKEVYDILIAMEAEE